MGAIPSGSSPYSQMPRKVCRSAELGSLNSAAVKDLRDRVLSSLEYVSALISSPEAVDRTAYLREISSSSTRVTIARPGSAIANRCGVFHYLVVCVLQLVCVLQTG